MLTVVLLKYSALDTISTRVGVTVYGLISSNYVLVPALLPLIIMLLVSSRDICVNPLAVYIDVKLLSTYDFVATS